MDAFSNEIPAPGKGAGKTDTTDSHRHHAEQQQRKKIPPPSTVVTGPVLDINQPSTSASHRQLLQIEEGTHHDRPPTGRRGRRRHKKNKYLPLDPSNPDDQKAHTVQSAIQTRSPGSLNFSQQAPPNPGGQADVRKRTPRNKRHREEPERMDTVEAAESLSEPARATLPSPGRLPRLKKKRPAKTTPPAHPSYSEYTHVGERSAPTYPSTYKKPLIQQTLMEAVGRSRRAPVQNQRGRRASNISLFEYSSSDDTYDSFSDESSGSVED